MANVVSLIAVRERLAREEHERQLDLKLAAGRDQRAAEMEAQYYEVAAKVHLPKAERDWMLAMLAGDWEGADRAAKLFGDIPKPPDLRLIS